MRMYAQSDIGYRCRILTAEYTLGDQFPRTSPHNPHTQHALRFRVYDELCHTIIAVESSCPARCAPGKTGNLNRTVLLLRLGLGQTAPGDFWIGKNYSGDCTRLKDNLTSSNSLSHYTTLMCGLVGQHRFSSNISDCIYRALSRLASEIYLDKSVRINFHPCIF